MTTQTSPKQILLQIGIIITLLILLLGGSLLLDQIPMSAARPPDTMKTIEDFQAWKVGAILGGGMFESEGVTYTVMLAPAGRYLASGPSAYLFDERGQFFDWTADMGDFFTVKNRLDLTGGIGPNIQRENPQQ